jgi:pullulanase
MNPHPFRFPLRSAAMRGAFVVASLALALIAAGAVSANTPDPTSVTIAGSLQSELGCPADWQPDCASTHLVFDPGDGVWQGTFNVPAGAWEYKAALNNGWTENYGANAAPGGGNITLSLGAVAAVKFYYSHETHWVTSNKNAVIATAAGSFQSELGCSGDWQPDCLRSWLQDPDGDGVYTFTTSALPAGSYEAKVAINESWDENYGADGAPGGANIPFTVASDCSGVEFRYDATTHVLTIGPSGGPLPQPASVTIPGSFQSELGCSGDWQPDCAATHLGFDPGDGVWQGTFNIPAGNYEYKAALNDSWDENYGANAQLNGANLTLSLGSDAAVKFYYDNASHWVTSNKNAVIATVPGSFQSELGCPGDWQPDCLRSWLEDPDGDGIYTFETRALPAGNFEAKVAINESWDENYGAGGAPGGANIAFAVPQACANMFFRYDSSTHVLTISAQGAPKGNLALARAHWLTRDTLAWNPGPSAAGAVTKLHFAADGGLNLTTNGVEGGDSITLTYDASGLSAVLKEKFPYLADFSAFHIAPEDLAKAPAILRGQIAVSVTDANGTLMDATSLQIPGVLDDLYTFRGPLGPRFVSGAPTLAVWAPTARSVTLDLFDDGAPSTTATAVPMTGDPATGVWTATGTPGWNGKYYLYDVEVYVRSTGKVEHNLVTDPYSISLSTNSARSQLVDLDDPAWMPAGWTTYPKPRLAAPEDIALYELHVRDFSVNDTTVPAPWRGTFKAFTVMGSNGMRHLAALGRAGLTHVHLLPAFDFATVDEVKSHWLTPGDLSGFPPDSDRQQAAVTAVADQDGFNWGYDPWHYTVPEGSYATDPEGPARIREFREMVQALNRSGLRVVMDVVYNHTTAAGQDARSVLDRVVPGYYHRLNLDGNIETSTCCQNTATEHAMMEKLMVDSVTTWAKAYKVDGFRFDLMGHHMKSNMLAVRSALDALTPSEAGVDGKAVYVYGEGWNFGEVANNARGVNAVQANMAGTGIGTFNDRMRDGARGGGPFSPIRDQGFIDGLFYDPNETNQGSPADQQSRLLLLSDWIRSGLAGSLKDYQFVDRYGNLVPSSQVDYNGQPSGYTLDPQEVINYVSAHDNQGLFDTVQVKAPSSASLDDRIRMHNLGVDLVALAQGVPFFHAGDDILRSKSGDGNSYNSGDWFNALDFTYHSNTWGVGLPPARDNQANWPVLAPLLADPDLTASEGQIRGANEHFREMLAIRKSTPLFRLHTGAEVSGRLAFWNTGPSQLPGLVVMSLDDPHGDHDFRVKLVVTLFNANDDAQTFANPALAGWKIRLHPILASSADPVVRTAKFDRAAGAFSVPGRTTAVFVAPRSPQEQIDLLLGDVHDLVASGVLSPGRGNALASKLDAARGSLDRGRPNAAINQMNAFINQAQAFVRAEILTPAQGMDLIGNARIVIGNAGG